MNGFTNSIPLVELDLERRYVATKLLCPENLGTARLHPDCISSNPLRLVYLAILRCEADTGMWDTIQVINVLEHEGTLGRGVTKDFVNTLSDMGYDQRLLSGEPTVERLTKLALARKQRLLLLDAIGSLESGYYENARISIVDTANLAISGIDTNIKTAYELTQATQNSLSNPEENKKRILFGIPIIDRSIGGITAGSLTIIGGYTTTGKSSLTLLGALNMALDGYRVGVISCEDTEEVWGSRLLAHLSDVPASQLFRGDFSSERLRFILERIQPGIDRAKTIPLHVAYCIGSEKTDILESARKLIVDNRCDVIYLDYIQAIRFDTKANRYDKVVGDVAKQLKGMAHSYKVPLVICSQLHRPKEKAYQEPFVTDLKESGDLENESDVIMLLWKTSDKPNAETYFKIAKCKWSPEGTRGILRRSTTNGMIIGISEGTHESNTNKSNNNGYKQARNYTETNNDYD